MVFMDTQRRAIFHFRKSAGKIDTVVYQRPLERVKTIKRIVIPLPMAGSEGVASELTIPLS